jgi:hypothetical protein
MVLTFVIEANIKVLETIDRDSREALVDMDRALMDAFLDLGRRWIGASPVIKEYEDPTHSELVPEDRLEEIEKKIEDLVELITSEEAEPYLGPSLPGVTRDMSVYPWDKDDPLKNRKMRAAAFGSYSNQLRKAIEAPPKGIENRAGVYAGIFSLVVAILQLFLPK